MQFELRLGQQYLPITEEAEVTFLLRLLRDSQKQAAEFPIDIRQVLDRSGSMSEPADGGLTKIEALKAAVKQSLELLRQGKDRLCIVVFDDEMQVILDPTVVSDINAIKRLIGGIDTGNTTHLSSPLRYALDVGPMKDALPKIIIFTDGLVNTPSEDLEEKACYDLARQANKMGTPLAIFGTGTAYNERFLKRMAELAGRGSYFEHVKQVGAMRLRLEDDLENLKSVQDRDVRVIIQAEPSAEILEAFKYVPQQQNLPVSGKAVQDEFPGLDIRGQAYLIKTKVRTGNAVGDFKVAVITVNWQSPAGNVSKTFDVAVNFTSDENLLSPIDKTVRNTVLNTAAVEATLAGQFPRAQTLFETSGNQDMAEKVKTLGNGDEDKKRTLRTATVTDANKGITGKKGGK